MEWDSISKFQITIKLYGHSSYKPFEGPITMCSIFLSFEKCNFISI